MTDWCMHFSSRDAGQAGHVYVCRLGHDVVELAGGRHGIRWTMPCNDDVVDGFCKKSCKDFMTAASEVRRRAQKVREQRERASQGESP